MPRQWNDAGFLVLAETEPATARHHFDLLMTSSRSFFSGKQWRAHLASTGVTHTTNFCRRRERRHPVTSSQRYCLFGFFFFVVVVVFYLRVIEVGRCRSLQERRCDDDGEHSEERCHVCAASSGTTGAEQGSTRGGRASNLQPRRGPDSQTLMDVRGAQSCSNGGGGGSPFIPPNHRQPPSLFSHSPLSSLDLCSLLPIPKRVAFPKS